MEKNRKKYRKQTSFKNKQKISNLTKVVVKIEKHYKIPQDIEWAMENGIFFILQSRPITTLKKI
jgi:pyruvate,water dikinase